MRRPSGPTAQERDAFCEATKVDPPPPTSTREPTVPDSPPLPPAAVLRKLRAGEWRVRGDCQISVRHLTRDEARSKLERFLRAQRREGNWFVLVIHGKGLGAPEGLPVLAPLVPKWLAGWKPELVVGWGKAHQRDGGGGALYVVLTTARS